MKPFTTIAAIILAIVALVHLYRLIRPFTITVAGWDAPQWISIVGLVVAGGVSIMLWREARS